MTSVIINNNPHSFYYDTSSDIDYIKDEVDYIKKEIKYDHKNLSKAKWKNGLKRKRK